MQQIHTDRVAPSTAPLSQAIRHDSLVFVSGQVPRTPEGELVTGSMEDQAAQVMDNIGEILREAGGSFRDVVKATVFLTDQDDFRTFNEVYESYFEDPYPARSAFVVDELVLDDIRVEVEAIAVV